MYRCARIVKDMFTGRDGWTRRFTGHSVGGFPSPSHLQMFVCQRESSAEALIRSNPITPEHIGTRDKRFILAAVVDSCHVKMMRSHSWHNAH